MALGKRLSAAGVALNSSLWMGIGLPKNRVVGLFSMLSPKILLLGSFLARGLAMIKARASGARLRLLAGGAIVFGRLHV